MNDTPCLCDGRAGIRCDEHQCDLAGPGEPGNPQQCRVCWLRLNRPPLVERPARSAPCLFLGEVVDRRGCPCPAKWLRKCAVHQTCTIEQCKTCPDYEAT